MLRIRSSSDQCFKGRNTDSSTLSYITVSSKHSSSENHCTSVTKTFILPCSQALFVQACLPTQQIWQRLYKKRFSSWMYRTAHIACITSRVGREKNNSGTPIGHVYLTLVHQQAKIHSTTSCHCGQFCIQWTHTHAAVLRLYFEVLKLLLGKVSLQVWAPRSSRYSRVLITWMEHTGHQVSLKYLLMSCCVFPKSSPNWWMVHLSLYCSRRCFPREPNGPLSIIRKNGETWGAERTKNHRTTSLVNYLLNSENDYSLWKVP